MPELCRGVRRGRALRKDPTDENNNQQIEGQKAPMNNARGRRRRPAARANNTGVGGRGRGRKKVTTAAVEVLPAAEVLSAVAEEKVEISSSLKEDNKGVEKREGEELALGDRVREEVAEREMDEYDSGGGADGRRRNRE